jgi:transposase
MLIPYENKNIFMASNPVDFRMSIDGLSSFIQRETGNHLHDGSVYVFHNSHKDKIKCLFWDRNGFVLYYKRLDKCKFKLKKMLNEIETITGEDLEILLSGFDPKDAVLEKPRKRMTLEHKG